MKSKYLFGMAIAVVAVSACSPRAEEAYIKPNLPEEKVVQDNTQVFDPKVDILFVVDNSGSMQTHQTNLSKNVSKFTSTFTKSSVLDYNIGVVSTDMDGNSWGNRNLCCGQLLGGVRVVNKNTPNANAVLSGNLMVGTDGSPSEASFDPVAAALTDPLLNSFNAGFYRQDASLVVIFLTDAEDQSRQYSAQGLYDFLLNLKKGNANKFLGYGVIVPTGDTTRCARDEGGTTPLRIEDFLSRVVNNKNNVMNICDPDYGTRLASMAKDIVEKVGNVIYLDRPPDINSIRVTYGAIELPSDYKKGWSFDPHKNAIILGSEIDWSSQPSGSRVKVFYNAAKFED